MTTRHELFEAILSVPYNQTFEISYNAVGLPIQFPKRGTLLTEQEYRDKLIAGFAGDAVTFICCGGVKFSVDGRLCVFNIDAQLLDYLDPCTVNYAIINGVKIKP